MMSSCCSPLLIPVAAPLKLRALNSSKGCKRESAGFLWMSTPGFSAAPPGRQRNSSRRRPQGLAFRCQALQDLAPAASVAYGVLLLGGGLFAYSKSGSKGSLFGGLTGAALMGAAYFLMQAQESKAIGDALGFGSAFLFSAVFGIRLAATRKITPAGPLLALSIGALAIFIRAYLQDSI